MLYTVVYDQPYKRAQMLTYAGHVIATTPALSGHLGCQIDYVLSFYHHTRAKAAATPHAKPLPALLQGVERLQKILQLIAETPLTNRTIAL